jgi:hypothetical protein
MLDNNIKCAQNTMFNRNQQGFVTLRMDKRRKGKMGRGGEKEIWGEKESRCRGSRGD